MGYFLAFLCGLIVDDAIVRLYRRVASKIPKSVLHYGKKLTDGVGITEPKGKILKTDEWMFRKRVEDGENPLDLIIEP